MTATAQSPQATDSERLALSLRSVTKEYAADGSSVRALDGVDLDVQRGRFVSIMGPSGSGKSTLLHVAAGLERPSQGEVTVDGRSLAGLAERELAHMRRHHVGVVFQFFSLVPVLTVEENVALPGVISGMPAAERRARAETLLSLVGLAERRAHLPTRLSGGEQQRAAVARALWFRPALLLADEPTGNLDSRTGAALLELLRETQEALDQTIVLVTHDPNAAAFGDEVVVLRDGHIAGRRELTRAARGEGGASRARRLLRWLQELSE